MTTPLEPTPQQIEAIAAALRWDYDGARAAWAVIAPMVLEEVLEPTPPMIDAMERALERATWTDTDGCNNVSTGWTTDVLAAIRATKGDAG